MAEPPKELLHQIPAGELLSFLIADQGATLLFSI